MFKEKSSHQDNEHLENVLIHCMHCPAADNIIDYSTVFQSSDTHLQGCICPKQIQLPKSSVPMHKLTRLF